MPSRKPSKDKQPTEEPASQLPLDLGEFTLVEPAGKLTKGKQKDPALIAPGRIERVTSREEFEAAIIALGGDRIGIRNATGALYRAAFRMTASELYQHYGVAAERDFLPLVVQRLIQVHEMLNAEKLRQHTLPAGMQEQAEINRHLVVIVQKQTQQTQIFFATYNFFGVTAQLGKRNASLKAQPSITVNTDEYGPVECEVLEVENDADIPF